MCAAALDALRVRRVYFGCANDKFGGCGSVMGLHASGAHAAWGGAGGAGGGGGETHGGDGEDCGPPGGGGGGGGGGDAGFECRGGLCAAEAIDLFKQFYAMGNPNGVWVALLAS